MYLRRIAAILMTILSVIVLNIQNCNVLAQNGHFLHRKVIHVFLLVNNVIERLCPDFPNA